MQKKLLRKISAHLHDKSPEETMNRRNISKHNKGYLYDKPIASIILNGKKLKPFSQKLGIKHFKGDKILFSHMGKKVPVLVSTLDFSHFCRNFVSYFINSYNTLQNSFNLS
jgi:hypothetical protein